MSNVVVEHTLLLPLLIIVVILFPMAANAMMTSYHEQQRILLVNGALNQFTATIQQLSYTLNQEKFLVGNITKTNPLPPTIDTYYYSLIATPGNESTVTFTLTFPGKDLQANKTMILYPNVLWTSSTFISSSPDAAINIEKLGNGTLMYGLVGGG